MVKADLEQFSDESAYLSSYCDPDLFYAFEETFRALNEEWVRLLSAVGGVRPFLSVATARHIREDDDES